MDFITCYICGKPAKDSTDMLCAECRAPYLTYSGIAGEQNIVLPGAKEESDRLRKIIKEALEYGEKFEFDTGALARGGLQATLHILRKGLSK